MPQTVRQLLTGLRVLVLLTVIVGIGYPLVTLGVARVAFDDQRTGSLVRHDGQVVGSALIGQPFSPDTWFLPRPSASDYDALASGGSNAGPDEPGLVATVQARRAEVAAREHVDPGQVPPDAVTASASGLDPYISVAYARLQVPRVAAARRLDPGAVAALVTAHTRPRTLGFLGMPRVDVLELNLALAELR